MACGFDNFLADVSVIGRDESTGDVYRNANVLYEVGWSLASRQPGEVLLIREDPQRFLFEVNTIPHLAFDSLFKEIKRGPIPKSEQIEARYPLSMILRTVRGSRPSV
jgi:hypothetical protein